VNCPSTGVIRTFLSGFLACVSKNSRKTQANEFIDIELFGPDNLSNGYESSEILDAVREGTLEVIRGAKAFERDSVTFSDPLLPWAVWGLIGWVKNPNGPTSVIDFGGSLGSTFYQLECFLGTVEVDWRIVEQANYVAEGRRITSDPRLTFFEDFATAAESNNPHLVYCGSAIQYLDDPLGTLKEFSESRAEAIFLDKIPMVDGPGFSVVQKVPSSIYSATYPMKVLAEQQVLEIFANEWTLATLQTLKAGPTTTTTGKRFRWVQALFVKKGSILAVSGKNDL